MSKPIGLGQRAREYMDQNNCSFQEAGRAVLKQVREEKAITREVTKQNLITGCDMAQSVDELRIVVKRLVQEVM